MDLRIALPRLPVTNAGASGTVSSGRQGRGEPGVRAGELGSLSVLCHVLGVAGASSPYNESGMP